MPTYSSDSGILAGDRMSCEAWRGAAVCPFGSGAARWQYPIAAAAISKNYDETISKLEVARALQCCRTKFLCNLCILYARAVSRVH